jgi:membrane protein DedA with SNARE-associated domain
MRYGHISYPQNIQQTNQEFDSLILRIGSFHLQKNFLRYLGQYLEESGLDSILIEAYIYGMNTLSSILKGTQYNRMNLNILFTIG